MGKRISIWAIVVISILLLSPTPGLAMMFSDSEGVRVRDRAITMDLRPIRHAPTRGSFMVTPEPVTAAIFGLGLLGLIKLKTKRII